MTEHSHRLTVRTVLSLGLQHEVYGREGGMLARQAANPSNSSHSHLPGRRTKKLAPSERRQFLGIKKIFQHAQEREPEPTSEELRDRHYQES